MDEKPFGGWISSFKPFKTLWLEHIGFHHLPVKNNETSSSWFKKNKSYGLTSLKLTAKAPENGWLEYFLVSFWGV